MFDSINLPSADTKFTQVKLGEMRAWLSRRSYHPLDMISCASRGHILQALFNVVLAEVNKFSVFC